MNRAFVQGRGPVKNFNSGRNSDEKAKDREDHAGVHRLTGYEHVMAPDHKSENSDGHARRADPRIAVNSFARKTRDQFADHAHSRQNHDVNRRMRIEPEQMLE